VILSSSQVIYKEKKKLFSGRVLFGEGGSLHDPCLGQHHVAQGSKIFVYHPIASMARKVLAFKVSSHGWTLFEYRFRDCMVPTSQVLKYHAL